MYEQLRHFWTIFFLLKFFSENQFHFQIYNKQKYSKLESIISLTLFGGS